VVDLDAALGEEFLDVAVGEAEPQVLANRQHDHVGWKQKPAKADQVRGAARERRGFIAAVCLPAAPSQQLQQRRGISVFFTNPSTSVLNSRALSWSST
jgi:hypothetical protein